MLNLLRFLCRGFCGGPLFGTVASKDALHAVVPFVTRVFICAIGRQVHGNDGGPRLGKRPRVRHGELVEERVRIGTSEALNQVQAVGGPSEARLVGEVDRFDDQ